LIENNGRTKFMVDSEIQKWRKDGKHLPPIMRDFHDQKDLFKAIHQLTDHEMCGKISWVDAHIYTIDMFLWFMARHGYTIQKTRKKLNFESLEANIEYCRAERDKMFLGLLKGGLED
jgi:hypothetical protein